MERSEISAKVKKVVAQVLGVKADGLKDEDRFVDDLGAESIQSLELVAAFEDEFDIDMEEEAALAIKTVGGAVDFIGKCL